MSLDSCLGTTSLQTMAKYSKFFSSDPDWQRYYEKNPEYALETEPSLVGPVNISADRKAQMVEEARWSKEHSLESFGYSATTSTVSVRDAYQIPIKLYHPLQARDRSSLPLLFVTHGGGWVQGTFVTEEVWLLYPIFKEFQVTVVSVEYRLAPEHPYPAYVNDITDVFTNIRGRSDEIGFDPKRVFLAGSSAGGCSALVLAQKSEAMARPVQGVIANVPVTCHPDHFPTDKYEYTSYDQCFGTLLSASEMRDVWKMVTPNSRDGERSEVSPLLGDVSGLPPHFITIAGQDPLRDEAFAYVEKLKEAGVTVMAHIYPGVPHTFAEIEELVMTKKFHGDLVAGVRVLFEVSG